MSFDLKKALSKSLVLLAGDEEYLRRRALGEIVQAVTGEDDFDLEKTLAGVSQPQDWLASAGTAPFLGERRAVIIRNVLRHENVADASESFLAGVKALPSSALLVLVADEESGDETKQKRLLRVRKSWEDMVAKAGGYVEPFKVDSKALRLNLKSEVASQDKAMTDRAADLLIEMTGGSLSRALEELDKLVVFVGQEKQIQENDVRDVVVPSREWNVFKMIEAIIASQAPQALRQLRIVVGSTAKAEEIGYRSLLPLLNKQLRLIWQARLCVEARCDPGNAPVEVRQWFPAKPNIASEAPWAQGRAMTAAQRISLDQVTELLAQVCDADARLKGQLTSFNGIDTLERMALEMMAIVRPKPPVRV